MGRGEVVKLTGVQRVGDKGKVERGRGVPWGGPEKGTRVRDCEMGGRVTQGVWKALDSPPKPGSGPVLLHHLAVSSWAKHLTSLKFDCYVWGQKLCVRCSLGPSLVSRSTCWSFSWEFLSPVFLPQGSHFTFSQEDFLTSILPALTEVDTVVFIFTLDGEREAGRDGVRGWGQQSDSEELSVFWVRGPLLGGRDWSVCSGPQGRRRNSGASSLSTPMPSPLPRQPGRGADPGGAGEREDLQHPGLGTRHCGAVPAGEGPASGRGPGWEFQQGLPTDDNPAPLAATSVFPDPSEETLPFHHQHHVATAFLRI